MDRIIAKTTWTPRRSLKTLIAAIVQMRRARMDAAKLDQLSADRLRDMGITGRTDANLRYSGQAGDLPKATLW